MKINYQIKNKIAQSEAFGLIIVVLLLFVAVLIFAKLEGNDSGNLRESFEVTAISSNTINTFLNTNVPLCIQKTYSELFIDCIKDEFSTCNGEQECSLFLNDASIMFGSIIGKKLSMDYELIVEATEVLPEDLERGLSSADGCPDGSAGEEFLLPLNPGTATLTLIVCFR